MKSICPIIKEECLWDKCVFFKDGFCSFVIGMDAIIIMKTELEALSMRVRNIESKMMS
jgi:hypothetical protein